MTTAKWPRPSTYRVARISALLTASLLAMACPRPAGARWVHPHLLEQKMGEAGDLAGLFAPNEAYPLVAAPTADLLVPAPEDCVKLYGMERLIGPLIRAEHSSLRGTRVCATGRVRDDPPGECLVGLEVSSVAFGKCQ